MPLIFHSFRASCITRCRMANWRFICHYILKLERWYCRVSEQTCFSCPKGLKYVNVREDKNADQSSYLLSFALFASDCFEFSRRTMMLMRAFQLEKPVRSDSTRVEQFKWKRSTPSIDIRGLKSGGAVFVRLRWAACLPGAKNRFYVCVRPFWKL